MKISAKEHLEWIYQRLVVVYGENPQYDYMLNLKLIVDSMDSSSIDEMVKAHRGDDPEDMQANEEFWDAFAHRCNDPDGPPKGYKLKDK